MLDWKESVLDDATFRIPDHYQLVQYEAEIPAGEAPEGKKKGRFGLKDLFKKN